MIQTVVLRIKTPSLNAWILMQGNVITADQCSGVLNDRVYFPSKTVCNACYQGNLYDTIENPFVKTCVALS